MNNITQLWAEVFFGIDMALIFGILWFGNKKKSHDD
jgi:hypothetical protein